MKFERFAYDENNNKIFIGVTNDNKPFNIQVSNTPYAGYTADQMLSIVETLGYFKGRKDVVNPSLDSVGLNLFDKDNSDSLIEIKLNDYTWSESVAYTLYDSNQNTISSGTANTIINTQARYISFSGIIDTDTFMLVEGDTLPINYKPYNSQTIKWIASGGSVGTAYDEIVNSGEGYDLYTRIATDTTVVKNATEWQISNDSGDTIRAYSESAGLDTLGYVTPTNAEDLANAYLKIGADRFNLLDINGQDSEDNEGFNIRSSGSSVAGAFMLRLLKSRLSSVTDAGVQAFLQSNDVTFIYETEDVTITQNIDYDGGLIQEKVTTLSQDQACEYNLTFGVNKDEQIKVNTENNAKTQSQVDKVETSIENIETSLTNISSEIDDISNDITTIQGDITDIEGDIGDVNTLNTTSKEVVGAINEVKGEVNGVTWLNSVPTFGDIATAYPLPSVGDAVVVQSTQMIWIYSGTTWVAMQDIIETDLGIDNRDANTLDITSSTGFGATIPSANGSLSGLMTSSDKGKLDDIIISDSINLNNVKEEIGLSSTITQITSSTLDSNATILYNSVNLSNYTRFAIMVGTDTVIANTIFIDISQTLTGTLTLLPCFEGLANSYSAKFFIDGNSIKAYYANTRSLDSTTRFTSSEIYSHKVIGIK